MIIDGKADYGNDGDGNIHLDRRVAQANKNGQVQDVFMLLGHWCFVQWFTSLSQMWFLIKPCSEPDTASCVWQVGQGRLRCRLQGGFLSLPSLSSLTPISLFLPVLSFSTYSLFREQNSNHFMKIFHFVCSGKCGWSEYYVFKFHRTCYRWRWG